MHHSFLDAQGPGHGFSSLSRNDLELHLPEGSSGQVTRTLLHIDTTVIFNSDRALELEKAGSNWKKKKNQTDSFQYMNETNCGMSILVEYYKVMNREQTVCA